MTKIESYGGGDETPAPVPARPTVGDVVATLTGHDEMAIHRRFHAPWEEMSGSMLARAMGMVLCRRDGMGEADAYGKIMGMALQELKGMFAELSGDTTDPDSGELGKAV